jgi:hypothetical protein
VSGVTADSFVPGFEFVIAANGHGPQMHGTALLILLALAVVGGLVYLVRARMRSDRGHTDDRSPEASDRNPES